MDQLACSNGLGVTGPGTNGYLRAVLIELLTTTTAKVVTTRNDFGRLFEGTLGRDLLAMLSSRLYICDFLEDAIQDLEWDLAMYEAEQANPDLLHNAAYQEPRTYWIATPGQDDDVVLPVVQQGSAHQLTGIMIGHWTHGATYVVDASGRITTTHDTDGTDATELVAPTLTPAEAISRLRSLAYSTEGSHA